MADCVITKRFWHPRDAQCAIDNQGFLRDPDQKLGSALNPGFVTLESIRKQACAILLGESGMGKTTALKSTYGTEYVMRAAQVATKHIDLGQIGSAQELRSELFDETACSTDGVLELVLDSLDECSVKDAVGIIIDEVKRHKEVLSSLRLRIACRSADWPTYADEDLRTLFHVGGTKAIVYELCPFRRADVAQIAKSCSVNPEAFIQAILQQDLAPLAVRPITLRFLIGEYAENPEGFVGAASCDLYERGMGALARDPNNRRNENGADVPADIKVAVAERLAAISVFSGRRHLYPHPQAEADRSPSALSYEDVVKVVCQGIDLGGFAIPEVTGALFDGSGFFATGGTVGTTWAHASYADYLAAKYVIERRIHDETITGLLFARDGRKKVVRQLRPVAAWLAAMSPTVRATIAREDPELSLERVPAQLRGDSEKQAELQALLDEHSRQDVLYARYDLMSKLGGLKYTGVSNQLKPYLVDGTAAPAARELACMCVPAMMLDDLCDDCVTIALNPAESNVIVRTRAIEAVAAAGTQDMLRQLRSLVLASERSPKEPLEVFGAAVDVLWRAQLTQQELFDALPLPRESVLGEYEYFLDQKLGPSLTEGDLPCALEWVAHLDEPWLSSSAAPSLIDTIIRSAWQLLLAGSSRIPVDAFAAAYWNLASQRDSALLENHGQSDHGLFLKAPIALRCSILQTLLAQNELTATSALYLVSSAAPLLDSSDFEWVLDLLVRSPHANERVVLAQLAGWLFDRSSVRHIDALLTHGSVAEVHAKFKELIDTVDLDSITAHKMRTDYESYQELELRTVVEKRKQEEREAKKPTLATVSQTADTILNDSSKTTFQKWYQFYRAVVIASSEPDQYGMSLDISHLSGWEKLVPSVKDAAVECAIYYLNEVDPGTDEWVGTDRPIDGALYGLPCLVLVAEESGVSSLSDRQVERWFPVFLACPWDWQDAERPRLSAMLIALAGRNHDVLINTVRAFLRRAGSEQHPSTDVLKRLEVLWDDEIAQLVLSAAQMSETGSELLSWCLKKLCEKRVPNATDVALTVIEQGTQDTSVPAVVERAATAAMALVRTLPGWWGLLHDLLHRSLTLWKSFVQRFSAVAFYEKPSLLDGLSGGQMGTFYVWTRDAFPEMKDAPEAGAHFVTPIEQVQDLVRALLDRLRAGTDASSVEAVQAIRDHYSDQGWLNAVLTETEDNYAANTWSPPSVDELIQLLDVTGSRYVEDEDQLLKVLDEQLTALQGKLHGETPAWWQLWNEYNKTFRPKEETRISDWVKEQLEVCLVGSHIIVNREVEIRPGAGLGAAGERTDIKVDATREGASNVEVIVEVKGCWNPGLLTNMADQLAHRYLADNACHHGIYLVAWFNWDGWDAKDYRRNAAFRIERGELEQRLLRQAEELAAEGYLILPEFLDFTPPNTCAKAR